jgi:hypothetical protein
LQVRQRQGSGFVSEDNLSSIKNRAVEIDIPIFQLRELEGNLINPEVIKFTQFGMIGGLRNQRDGYTYFGYKKTNANNKVINDFILNNPTMAALPTDHLFKIWYSQGNSLLIVEKKKLMLAGEFIDDNFILFLKLSRPFKIQKKHLISLGDMHFSIEVENQYF